MLVVDEFFPALQGEGTQMGVPSIFVRLGGCNLKCEGFGCSTVSPLDNKTVIKGCDSIHAVNSKHFKHLWTYYDKYNDLIQDLEQCMNTSNMYSEKQDIIFTGGEPLLQHKEQVFLDTLEYYISRGHRIFIETNGTIAIDFEEYPIYKKVSFSMSVKMSNSGEPEHRRWKPEVTNNYIKNTKGSYFKFVLDKKQAKEGAKEVLEYLNQIPTFGLVYCMAQGETNEELQENAKEVYEFCLLNGFRYSDRLHIRIFNDLRGV